MIPDANEDPNIAYDLLADRQGDREAGDGGLRHHGRAGRGQPLRWGRGWGCSPSPPDTDSVWYYDGAPAWVNFPPAVAGDHLGHRGSQRRGQRRHLLQGLIVALYQKINGVWTLCQRPYVKKNGVWTACRAGLGEALRDLGQGLRVRRHSAQPARDHAGGDRGLRHGQGREDAGHPLHQGRESGCPGGQRPRCCG